MFHTFYMSRFFLFYRAMAEMCRQVALNIQPSSFHTLMIKKINVCRAVLLDSR
jgi:hypothetical protein